jgi:hypothetical protein
VSEIKHTFASIKTDGRWEIITPDGEVVASFPDQDSAEDLEMSLNMVMTDAAYKPGAVISI